MKITTRCGEQAVDQLNEALLNKAMAAHVVKLDKVRADTTVVPANVAYPTDSGLLAKGVAKLTKTVAALHALGLARRTGFRDRTRSVRRRAHQIAAWLRRRSGDAKDEVLGLTGELATIAEAAIKDAQVVATNARRSLRRAGRGPRAGQQPSSPISSAPSACWNRSWPRPAAASPARSLPGRPGSCRSTTPMPVPSPRVGSASRSSSATRPR